jgi:hypothetical protein
MSQYFFFMFCTPCQILSNFYDLKTFLKYTAEKINCQKIYFFCGSDINEHCNGISELDNIFNFCNLSVYFGDGVPRITAQEADNSEGGSGYGSCFGTKYFHV